MTRPAANNEIASPEVAARVSPTTTFPSRLSESGDVESEIEIVESEGVAASTGVTFRVVILCLALAAAFGYIIPVIDYKFFNTFLGATHLPPGAVGALLLMVLVVNPLLRLISRRLAFSRNEVLTVYLSCLFSTLVPGIGGNNYWVSFIIGSFYYSTSENKWFDFLKGLPPWFTPALNADGTYNRYVVEAWYTGLGQDGTIPWGAWIVPLLAWSAFMFASFLMMGCLSVMLRAQWGEHEALSFPMLRLPLEMTRDMEAGRHSEIGFFRNPLMWVGFGIAVFIQLMNGLHLYFPAVPAIVLNLDTGRYLSEAPWNQIGSVPLIVYPIAVGIAYLLTSEISFSLWFFFWILKFQAMAAYYVGLPPATLPRMLESNSPIFTGFQEVGANVAYVALVLWTGRRHFAHVFRRAFGRAPKDEAEKSEALPYPVAFWGFVLSFGFMVAWGVCAGKSVSLSLLLWTLYLVIAIVLSRVVAEGGLLFVHHNWMPLGSLAHLVGLGPGTLLSPSQGIVPAAFMETSTIQDYRGSLMPSFVQSFKLAHDRKIAARPLFVLIFGVILVGMMVGFQMNVRLGYENGGLGLQGWLRTWGPQMAARGAYDLGGGVQAVDWVAWLWLTIGALTTYGLMLARSYLTWFPLHPIGYLMSQTYPAHALWFSFYLGWLAKSLLTRFGGVDTYRKVIPTFLGLALGDVAMMLLWIVIDGWQGRTGHQLMPG
jgi:hypothetical protein